MGYVNNPAPTPPTLSSLGVLDPERPFAQGLGQYFRRETLSRSLATQPVSRTLAFRTPITSTPTGTTFTRTLRTTPRLSLIRRIAPAIIERAAVEPPEAVSPAPLRTSMPPGPPPPPDRRPGWVWSESEARWYMPTVTDEFSEEEELLPGTGARALEPDLPWRRRDPVRMGYTMPADMRRPVARRGTGTMTPPASRDVDTVTEIVEPPKPAGMAALLPLALGAALLFAGGT